MTEPDAQWWSGVRALINRALDVLQAASEVDPEFAKAIAQVVGRAAPVAGAERVDTAQLAAQTPAEVEPPVAVQPPPAQVLALVERTLRLGDAGAFSIRAREDGEADPLLFVTPGPKVVREASSIPQGPADEPESFDAQEIVRRCRLKAEACRWQNQRSNRLDAGEDVREADQDLTRRARECSCFLWMVQPTRWRERGERAFAVVSGCYDAMADAVDLMRLVDAQGHPLEEPMALMAEASSALRGAIEDYASTGRDPDQQAVFNWLDNETGQRNVYIRRHMKLDDPAAPENYADLRRRVAHVRAQLEGSARARRERENLFGKIAYALKKLDEAFEARSFDAGHPQLRTLELAIDELIQRGVPPSNLRLRQMLQPALERFPDPVAPPLARVLEEIDAYLDQLAEAADGEQAIAEPTDALLSQAKSYLAGKCAVLTGGIPDERHRRRLESDLGLASLRWLQVKHGSSFETDAEPAIRDPNVSLVLAMTRFRSHRDGPAARRICKERGIPFVELTGGYGSRRVAHEILRQASGMLASMA